MKQKQLPSILGRKREELVYSLHKEGLRISEISSIFRMDHATISRIIKKHSSAITIKPYIEL